MREIYLDNAATTKAAEPVIAVMERVLREDYGNPSSLHKKGIDAERYLKTCAQRIAKALKCSDKEIIFTSGGTESNNLAITGGVHAKSRMGKHIIMSSVEHASVYQPFLALEKQGYELTVLPADRYGIIKREELEKALRPDTVFVSCMTVNNEIGAIEPISELAAVAHRHNPDILFHTDAVQGFGKLVLDVRKLGVDLLSVSGHKLHGPKGSGFLYKRDKVRLEPQILGGGQQKDMRSGTENVPAIAGLSEAVGLYAVHQQEYIANMLSCKKEFLNRILPLPYTRVNALPDDDISLDELCKCTAPHIVSVSFDGVRAEVLLHALEDKGIYVSSGSACSSNHPAVSGTLKAIGVEKKYLDSTLRFSFCPETTIEDIKEACTAITELVPVLSRFTVH